MKTPFTKCEQLCLTTVQGLLDILGASDVHVTNKDINYTNKHLGELLKNPDEYFYSKRIDDEIWCIHNLRVCTRKVIGDNKRIDVFLDGKYLMTLQETNFMLALTAPILFGSTHYVVSEISIDNLPHPCDYAVSVIIKNYINNRFIL